ISYFCLYAERFMGLANINWRLDEVPATVNHVVDTHKRHQLFLAFKEALTNVVRHSGATEVRLNIHQENGELSFVIVDNGCGMPQEDERTEEMSGINNMRARIEKLGGRFEMNGANGSGTTLKFFVPYANNNNHDNHSHS
ncbi:MAG TPA: ATP-binding protein, partial [Verrucomicrobiae bacterium]|nr:ATP-binding protein [Verrucomicrobiae bacterium]